MKLDSSLKFDHLYQEVQRARNKRVSCSFCRKSINSVHGGWECADDVISRCYWCPECKIKADKGEQTVRKMAHDSDLTTSFNSPECLSGKDLREKCGLKKEKLGVEESLVSNLDRNFMYECIRVAKETRILYAADAEERALFVRLLREIRKGHYLKGV